MQELLPGDVMQAVLSRIKQKCPELSSLVVGSVLC